MFDKLAGYLQKSSIIIKNIDVYSYGNSTPLRSTILFNQEGQYQLMEDDKSVDADYLLDAEDKLTFMPGLLDSHVHGQGGCDFADVGQSQKDIATIMQSLGKTGLSYTMATVVSLELPTLKNALAALNEYVLKEEIQPTPGATKIVGVHLEGPFIAKKCKGAHAETALQSQISLDLFNEIISAAPAIKQWKITIDPELPGAEQFIRDVKKLETKGIFTHVFIGHSNPNDKTLISKAIEAGAVGFTHVGNACQESCSREKRDLAESDATSHIVQWLLENPEQCPNGVELIVDGMHLSKNFIAMLHKKIGDKIVLVTDALGPTGLADGHYKLGSLPIIKDKGNFYLADTEGSYLMKETQLANGTTEKSKTLAGSAISLAQSIELYTQWFGESKNTASQHHESLYKVLIKNPRESSLSPNAIHDLPDNKNGVILDGEGCMILSLCNGLLRVHDKTIIPILDPTLPELEKYHPNFFPPKKLQISSLNQVQTNSLTN